MSKGSRSNKVADLIHRELSKMIRTASDDLKLGMITISGVVVTDDLSFAKVYVTVLEEDKQKSSVTALNDAAKLFRMNLSKSLTLRIVPKLRFYYDESLKVGLRIDELLNSVKESKSDHHE